METQYLERKEGKLAYTDYGGDGDLVLMLPGVGALRSEYRYLGPKLREAGFHPVSVDLRGQGESSVPWDAYDVPSVGGDILAMLDHLGANSAHLIGTSFAAAAAVWAAVEKPDRILSQVLIVPFVRDAEISPVMKSAFWLMMKNPWRVRTWAMYYGMMYPSRKPGDFQEYLRELKQNLSEGGRFDAVAELSFSSREPSDSRLEKVQAPTLVIMGTKDPDFPDPAKEGRIVAERTGGQLELIEGAGHYPQTEMPDVTARVIVEFLKRTGE